MIDIKLRNSILEDRIPYTSDVLYVATEGIIVGGPKLLNYVLAVEQCVEESPMREK